MGLTFLCINAAAYATLPEELRTDGVVLVTFGGTLSGHDYDSGLYSNE